MPDTSRLIKVNGIRLNTVTAGAGPPLVCVAGLAVTHADWAAVRQPLARVTRLVRRLILCTPFMRLRPMAEYVFRNNAALLRAGVPEHMVFRIIMPWLLPPGFFQDRAGKHDLIAPAAEARRMAAGMLRAAYQVLPTEHLVHNESPDRFCKIIIKFLELK